MKKAALQLFAVAACALTALAWSARAQETAASPLAVSATDVAESRPEAKPVDAPASAAEAVAQEAKPPARQRRREMPRVVMAEVGDEEITVEEYMKFIAKGGTRVVTMAETVPGKMRVLRLMISEKLLRRAMYDEGLLAPDHKPDAKEIWNAYVQLQEKHFPPRKEPPTDEQLYAYYEAHKDLFGIPESVRVQQIQLRVPADVTPEQAAAVRKRAEAILARLEKGESFAELAAEYTENPRAKVAKGDLGFLPRNTDPWLKQALEGLQVGEHTGVVKSSVGYEILAITDERPGAVAPFANVRRRVMLKMVKEEQDRARDAYLAGLAKAIGVEVVAPGLEGANPALPKAF
jgi:parvulin-like peptidyl-prolyl isomerase